MNFLKQLKTVKKYKMQVWVVMDQPGGLWKLKINPILNYLCILNIRLRLAWRLK